MTSLGITRIGYFIANGYRPAHVVGTRAVLGAMPLNRGVVVGPNQLPVQGQAGYTMVPTHSFGGVHDLDAVVIADHETADVFDDAFVQGLHAAIGDDTVVLAVGNATVALERAGIAHRSTEPTDPGWTRSGNVITADPSTGAIGAAYTILQEMRGTTITKFAELNLEYHPINRFPETTKASRAEVDALAPLKVGVLATHNNYAPDPIGAVDVFAQLPNTEFFYLNKTVGPVATITGATIVADTSFDECEQLDVLCIGATMPSDVDDPAVIDFVRQQFGGLKAAITTCAGVLVLSGVGGLEGERATSNFHMVDLVAEAKGTPSHDTVVASGKVYSAGPAIGSYEAALLAVADIHGPEVASFIEHDRLMYRPNPLHGVGTPELAGPVPATISRALIKPLSWLFQRSTQRAVAASA